MSCNAVPSCLCLALFLDFDRLQFLVSLPWILLSMSASVIAVLGATSRTSVLLRQIQQSLRNTPVEASQLLNEISDINLVLSQIEPLRSVVWTDDVSQTSETEVYQALTAQLRAVNSLIHEIDEHFRPLLYEPYSQSARSIFNKGPWRYRSEYSKLSERLRIVKLRLFDILNAFAL